MHPRQLRRLGSLAAALAVLLAASPSRANGRFPAAQYLIGSGTGARTRLALRTTFGVLVSDDDGARFSWWCEQALSYTGAWDPPLAFTADGALHVGLESGITRIAPGCAFESPPAPVANRQIADLSVSADARTVYAVEAVAGSQNRLLTSSDQGHTYAPAHLFAVGVVPLTVDAAPSLGSRMYATARAATAGRDEHARFFRSDDGGRSFGDTGADFYPVRDVSIAAVDARDPDVVWVRHGTAEGGGVVRRSLDGGRTFLEVTRTGSAVNGFALAPDGRVWVGSAEGGVERSTDGGRTFQHVFDTHVQCLRYHDGALYICSEWVRDNAALYRWRDGAPRPELLLRFTDVRASESCPGAGPDAPSAVCAARWPQQLSALYQDPSEPAAAEPALDAAVAPLPDAGLDATPDVVVPPSAPPAPRCGCSLVGGPARGGVAASLCALASLATVRARRRRRGG